MTLHFQPGFGIGIAEFNASYTLIIHTFMIMEVGMIRDKFVIFLYDVPKVLLTLSANHLPVLPMYFKLHRLHIVIQMPFCDVQEKESLMWNIVFAKAIDCVWMTFFLVGKNLRRHFRSQTMKLLWACVYGHVTP